MTTNQFSSDSEMDMEGSVIVMEFGLEESEQSRAMLVGR